MQAVGLKRAVKCPKCGEVFEAEIVISKKQAKAIYKGMKASTPAQAEIAAERLIGRDKKGELKF